ncbi:hypothetical protein [Janthinobacterium psychrotolerans]|uniref:Uncharacterized protein n=1 Tax=Janthinobacterium psychrotolerans TaxID=1747903 RepID=A0A1A7C7J1_9BURK|nr:hypothetical protein [Janthinobacterium psychrotolerans]OBV41682.1 hypothetical protein ASR47_10436 [Janthinobacterium psychrotolerans]
MLAKLKLLKTPAGPDTVLMISGVLIVWLAHDGMLSRPSTTALADPAMLFINLLLAAVVILSAAWDVLRPLGLSASRRIALHVLACSALFVPLLTWIVFFLNDVQAGDDFPWWLLAACLFWLPARRLAGLVFGIVLLCGLGMGAWQQGLANPSFTPVLWSAWIASYLVYLLYRVFKPEDALA